MSKQVTQETIDRLTEIKNEMMELAGETRELLRGTDNEGHAFAYWLGSIDCALSEEHGYVSREVTMADEIEDMQHRLDKTGEYAPDDEEEAEVSK